MRKILYWIGRGNVNVLEPFLSELRKSFEVISFPFEYDQDVIPFSADSEWSRWLREHPCDIWCGISLGASMMYSMASVSQELCPSEMTAINPFISRSQLSAERGFSMGGQWKLELRDSRLSINKFTVIISLNDIKIPMHHGIELLTQTSASEKDLIFIDSDHCISQSDLQTELAAMLSGKDYCNDKINKYSYIHQR